jgi:hypothetical protein
MTVYLVIPLPKLPYIHRIYIWFWPTLQTQHMRNPAKGALQAWYQSTLPLRLCSPGNSLRQTTEQQVDADAIVARAHRVVVVLSLYTHADPRKTLLPVHTCRSKEDILSEIRRLQAEMSQLDARVQGSNKAFNVQVRGEQYLLLWKPVMAV